jgi:CRISPR-associated protein Cas5t
MRQLHQKCGTTEYRGRIGRAFLLAERGRLTLPVWVDHVGSAGTRYVTGDLIPNWPIDRVPERSEMPLIAP